MQSGGCPLVVAATISVCIAVAAFAQEPKQYRCAHNYSRASPCRCHPSVPPRRTATSRKPAASSSVAARADRRSVLQTSTTGSRRAASSPARPDRSASGTLTAPGRWPGGAVNSSGDAHRQRQRHRRPRGGAATRQPRSIPAHPRADDGTNGTEMLSWRALRGQPGRNAVPAHFPSRPDRPA
jgi:hypothetical protein